MDNIRHEKSGNRESLLAALNGSITDDSVIIEESDNARIDTSWVCLDELM